MSEDALQIFIRPLAILGIADHAIRDQQQFGSTRVAGAVFGRQDGRGVHILEVMGILIKEDSTVSGGGITLDMESFEAEMRIFKEAYPMELLGWYSTGSLPVDSDLAVHRRFRSYSENPIYLQLDTTLGSKLAPSRSDGDELGLYVYTEESSGPLTTDMEVKTSATKFIRHKYIIEQEDSERVTLAAAMYSMSTRHGSGTRLVIEQTNNVWSNSTDLLAQRIQLVKAFLDQFAKGQLTPPPSRALLRRVKALCSSLPEVPQEELASEISSDVTHGLQLALTTVLLRLAQMSIT